MQDRKSEFWPRQLLKKWLSFQETGDDFDRDNDSNAEEFSESEDFDDSDVSGVEGSGDEDTRNFTESDADTDAISTADSDNSPLLRGQSESVRKQFAVNHEYKIAVGTWNVGGVLPPDDINLDAFLDSSNLADIYVLGFQEIVPLNSHNVLCVEDDCPSVVWDGLIRQALNRKNCCEEEPLRSCNSSLPSSMWHETDVHVPQVSDVKAPEETLESSFLIQKTPNSCDSQWLQDRRDLDGTGKPVTKDIRTAEDWLCEVNSREKAIPEESPLVDSSRKHSCSQYSRVASKQMVGVFISVWVRSDLRRYVHNVKVSVVGCGILNFLRNKRTVSEAMKMTSNIIEPLCGVPHGLQGAVSVSMSLHQTSFCFVCTHLTSGHKGGDEFRRNLDVADVLRRTTFPRLVKLSGIQLPETIMAHDRIIWLGDLNYRIDLPDKETWILVNQCDWKSLLPKDQLKTERESGRVFKGWHENAINFPPTYKFVVESDQYFGENTYKGDKRRTPAWCDRILSHGKGLKQLSYSMVEARLSDHRPVIARFIAEVEAVNGRKLSSRGSTGAKVNVEELLPKSYPICRIRSLPNTEHIAHSVDRCCQSCRISTEDY